ncbi:DMT family transporter [Roseovarius sp. 2305UL8-3]|uniref:DMT family transporter n=1 Tax=Roseovarius conchicola TaxID=3121636 RepID=UPI003529032E
MPNILPRHWLMLAFLGVIWGASFMFMSVALGGVGPLVLAATRITLGALFLLIILYAMGKRLPSLRGENGVMIWGFALAMAVFSNAVPFFLLGWGQQVVASGFAGVCMAVVPLFILPLAHWLVPGEQMSLRRFVGFLMGTLGVVVLIGPAAFASTGKDLELLAKLACVSAAGCYAIGSIFTRLCPEVDRLALSAAVLALAAVILIPVALSVEGVPAQLDSTTLWALLYLGILPTGIAQIILVTVIREAGPVFMSLVNYQVPIWSVIFGAVILLEPLPPSLLLGMAMILGGVALSQLGRLKKLFLRR